MGRLPPLLLLLLSGIGFALAFPRASWWPLAFVALIPLFSFLAKPKRVVPALGGFVWGVGFFGWLLAWLYHYGEMSRPLSVIAWLILVGYLSVYPGLFAHFGALLVQGYGTAGYALFPPLWVALEWIRGHALTGLPWGLAGYSLVRCPPLIQIVSVTGIYGASFLVLCPNALGAVWRHPGLERERRGYRLTAAVLALYLVCLGYGAWELGRVVQVPEVTVGIVQANIPQDQKWDPRSRQEILERHERLTEEATARGATLVFWSESSSPYSISYPRATPEGIRVKPSQPYRSRLEVLTSRLGISLLFGTVDYRESPSGPRPINAAALLHADGTWGETYAKMHLVPFGEYVPLAKVLFFVDRLVEGAIGDFLAGEEPVVVEAEGLTVGTTICFEAIFPELVRLFPSRGAEVLANLTNDAWFRWSAGPEQHFEMARVRAVENRRYLVRAANTGISGIVDPWGRVLARSTLGKMQILVGGVRPVEFRSVYNRVGDLFAILCVILVTSSLAVTYGIQWEWRRRGVSWP